MVAPYIARLSTIDTLQSSHTREQCHLWTLTLDSQKRYEFGVCLHFRRTLFKRRDIIIVDEKHHSSVGLRTIWLKLRELTNFLSLILNE